MLPASVSRSPVGARYIYPERSRRIVPTLSFSPLVSVNSALSALGACPDRVGVPQRYSHLSRPCFSPSPLFFTDHCPLITDHFLLTPLECADPQIAPITPLECAVPKTQHLKSFRMRSSVKSGGRGANC